jgi:hypothetical protein
MSAGQRAALDGNKRTIFAGAFVMDNAGNQFFAGAALALQQNPAFGGDHAI